VKRVVEWSDWIQSVRQEIDGVEKKANPIRVQAEQETLSPEMFVDVLSDLEQRNIQAYSLLGVVSPRQAVGLLLRTNFLDRRPAAAADDRKLLPQDVTLCGVSVRVEPGFPDDSLVLFPPGRVMMDGTSVSPVAVAVVQGLAVPDLDPETDPITVADVRNHLFAQANSDPDAGHDADADADADPETVVDSDMENAEDAERRGERFVSGLGDDDTGEKP
jgi:hypothetical protein